MAVPVARISPKGRGNTEKGPSADGSPFFLCHENTIYSVLSVESEEGKGSNFYLTLPIYKLENARNERL